MPRLTLLVVCFALGVTGVNAAEVFRDAYGEHGVHLGRCCSPASNWSESILTPGTFYHPHAIYYLVGTGDNRVEFWHPFDEGDGGKDMAAIHLDVAADFVLKHQVNETDQIQVKVVNKGWARVVNEDMTCMQESCPTLVLAGTTQVAARHEAGDALPLNDFLASWADKTGWVLTDDFVRYYFYDFNFDGHWVAIPLVSDTRVLVYNKTTFERMGIEPPLPAGAPLTNDKKTAHDKSPPVSQGVRWTWDEFVEVVENITAETGRPGWYFRGSWDEELKMSLMIARNWGASLYMMDHEERKACDLFETFIAAMNSTIEHLIRGNHITKDFIPTDTDEFLAWIEAEQLPPPENPPSNFPANNVEFKPGSKVLNGLAIVPPASLNDWYSSGETEIGGSGLFVNQRTRMELQALGWELLEEMLTRVTDYALVQRSPPPFDSVLEQEPWLGPEWLVAKEQVKSAVPAQYPNPGFREFGKLEELKPFRLMWMEMMYKNLNTSTATERLRSAVNSVIGTVCTEEEHSHPSCAECTTSDYKFDVSGCEPKTQRITVTFTPIESVVCHGGVDLPADTRIPCDHVKPTSSFGLFIITMSVVGGVLALTAAALVFAWKAQPVIRFSQPGFCVMFSMGVAMMCFGNLISIGEATDFSCCARFYVIGLGFDLAFGSLFSKVFRVWRIVEHKLQRRVRVPRSSPQMRHTIIVVSAAIVLDLAVLMLWTTLDPIQPTASTVYIPLSGNTAVEIRGTVCSSKSTLWVRLFLAIKPPARMPTPRTKVLLIAWGVYLSWVTRHISRSLVEGPEISWSIYNFALLAVVVCILSSARLDTEYWLLVQALVVVVGSTTALVLVLAPKFWATMRGDEVNVQCLAGSGLHRRSSNNDFVSRTELSSSHTPQNQQLLLCPRCRSRHDNNGRKNTAALVMPHLDIRQEGKPNPNAPSEGVVQYDYSSAPSFGPGVGVADQISGGGSENILLAEAAAATAKRALTMTWQANISPPPPTSGSGRSRKGPRGCGNTSSAASKRKPKGKKIFDWGVGHQQERSDGVGREWRRGGSSSLSSAHSELDAASMRRSLHAQARAMWAALYSESPREAEYGGIRGLRMPIPVDGGAPQPQPLSSPAEKRASSDAVQSPGKTSPRNFAPTHRRIYEGGSEPFGGGALGKGRQQSVMLAVAEGKALETGETKAEPVTRDERADTLSVNVLLEKDQDEGEAMAGREDVEKPLPVDPNAPSRSAALRSAAGSSANPPVVPLLPELPTGLRHGRTAGKPVPERRASWPNFETVFLEAAKISPGRPSPRGTLSVKEVPTPSHRNLNLGSGVPPLPLLSLASMADVGWRDKPSHVRSGAHPSAGSPHVLQGP